jgi:hypothetical protein
MNTLTKRLGFIFIFAIFIFSGRVYADYTPAELGCNNNGKICKLNPPSSSVYIFSTDDYIYGWAKFIGLPYPNSYNQNLKIAIHSYALKDSYLISPVNASLPIYMPWGATLDLPIKVHNLE